MRAATRFVLAPALLLGLLPVAIQRGAGLRGYRAESAKAQQEWEGKVRAIPDAGRLREYPKRLAAR